MSKDDEQQQVKVGQVWRDNDPRVDRLVIVTALPIPGGVKVEVSRCKPLGDGIFEEVGPRVLNHERRFQWRGRNGYRLIKDAP